MGRIKKLRLGYFMETEATWFSPAACNKTIFVTYLYVASCRRKEKQFSTGRELEVQESRGAANFGLADLISLLYGKSLIKRIAVERVSTERRLGWTYTDPSSSETSLQMWSCYYWNASISGEEEEVSKELGARPPLPRLWQHYWSLLLKASWKTSHSKLTLPSPLCSFSDWGLQIQGTGKVSTWKPSLNTVPCTAGKRLGDHSQLHHRALEERCLNCFVPCSSILLLRKQIMLSIARVRSKLILLMLLTFPSGFLWSEVLQTPTQRGWIAAETPAWTSTKILGESLPCTISPLRTTIKLLGVWILSH